MRVGLIVPGSLDTVSGGYLYDRMLLHYLRQRGDRVTVFSIPVSRYGRQLGRNLGGLGTWGRAALEVDLLLQDELAHPALFLLNRHLSSTGAPPLVTIVHHLRSSEHHPFPLRAFYRLVERAYLRTVDGFIFNSPTTQRAVRELAGRCRPGIVAYPAANHRPGIDSETAVRARALAHGPLRLLFVGNVIPRKGLDFLLDALALLPRARWRLQVVGDLAVAPAHVQRLQERVQRYGLAPYVRFHGRVADTAMPAHFAAADLLVMPSRYEGFGIAYLEGMGYGLPALAGRGGAAHELISPGQNGFLVAPGEVMLLATHLSALAADRHLLAEMSVAAFRRYHSHPTWAESMAQVRAFLLRRLEGGVAETQRANQE